MDAGARLPQLGAVVTLVNHKLPEQIFLQRTAESTDDVPVVRVLAGPRDPYTAERIGTLAFYSTQRGMEWYTKTSGPARFQPGKGMVFVTYFEDCTLHEEPVLELTLDDSDAVWTERIFSLFDL